MPVYVNDTAAYGVRSGTSYHAFVTGNYGKLASVSGHSNTYILESAMLSAVKAAGGAAWYVPDDFLTLGQNLITNGGPFVNSTGWANTTGAAASISGSYLRCTTTAIGGVTYSIQTTPGKQYLVSSAAAASDVSHGLRIFRADGSTTIVDSTYSASPGVLTVTFTAIDATSSVYLRSASSGVVDYSSVTVQEILSAKDYQDSAGTLPSYLGGTVGLLTDRSYGGELGPELIPDGAFGSSAGWTLGAGWSITGGKLIATAAATGTNAVINVGLVAGKSYLITYDIDSITAGATTPIANGATSAQQTTAGQKVSIIVPAGSSGNVGLNSSSATALTAVFDNFSVRELKGAHASQATSGNRPTITRIPRKLGPELVINGGFDSADGWTLAAAGTAVAPTVPSGQLVFNSASSDYTYARRFDSTPLVVGKTYAVSVDITSYTSGVFQVVAIGGTASIVSNAVSGAGKKQLVFTATQPNYGIEISRVSGSPFVASFDNISVREVLEWSYALTFDGTNDSLAATASVIGANLSQGHTMIAWGRLSAIGAYRRVVGDGVRMLGVESSGKASLFHNGPGALVGTTTLAAGQLFVLEGTWDGATAKLYLNNVLENSAALAAPSGTPVATAIGQTGALSSYWIGDIGGVVVCPAVMTDAQRAAVRKFAAAQLGMSL